MKFTSLEKVLSILLLLAVVIICIKTCSDREKTTPYVDQNQINSLEVKIWKDRFKLQHAQTSALKVSYDQFLNSKDSVILKLKEQVKNYKSLLVKTSFNDVSADTVMAEVIHDTAYINNDYGIAEKKVSTGFKYKDDWADIKGTINDKDSVAITYSIKNKFDVINRYEEQGFLKHKKLVVEIVNYNPHGQTDKVVSFTIQPRVKKFYETRSFIFVMGAITGAIIHKKLN